MSIPHGIKWEKYDDSSTFYATRCGHTIGFAGQRTDGSCYWKITAFHPPYRCKGRGECANIKNAKAALINAWKLWCDTLQLMPRETQPSDLG